MQDLMTNLAAFWKACGPWITMFLIPTILTGLTISPKTKEAHTMVEKIWNGLKIVLEFFSITTFKNVPGTFQLPLKMGRLLPKKETPMKMVAPDSPKQPVEPPSGPGSCAALVFVVALGGATLGTQPACNWWNGETAAEMKEGAIDCGKQAVMSNAAHLLPVIMAILTGNAPNWKQQLEAFTKELGADAVACAMQMASQQLLASVPASGTGEPTPEVKQAQSGVTKARTYVDEKGWKYAPARQ